MALKRGNVEQQEVATEERPTFNLDDEAAATAPVAETTPPAPAEPPAAPAAEEEEVVTGTLEDDRDNGTIQASEEHFSAPAPAQNTAVAPTAQSGVSSMAVQEMAEGGMEGLDLGFGAFPVISLGTDGEFSSADLPGLGTKEFDCIVQQSKKKFICKNGLADKDPETDFFYSFYSPSEAPNMPRVTTSNKDIDEILNAWKAKGWTPEWKKYLDVVVQLKGGEHDGQLAMLSIPQTSITRFSGHIMTQKLQRGQVQNQYVTKCSVGPKVKGSGFDFRPWSFSRAGDLEEEAAA